MRYTVVECKSCEICGKKITNEQIFDRNVVISDYDDREQRFHYYHLSCYLEGSNENTKRQTQ